MKHAVYCIARNLTQAETIVQSLRQAGFNSNEISGAVSGQVWDS
jgi:hypothetical protein